MQCLLIVNAGNLLDILFSFPAMTSSAWLIKKKEEEEGGWGSEQAAASIRQHRRTSHFASVLGDLMMLDKPVGAWGAGISCSGSGIIPISLQNDASNPTGRVHHGGGCPQRSQREQHSYDLEALTWRSSWKWSFWPSKTQNLGAWKAAVDSFQLTSGRANGGSDQHEFSWLKWTFWSTEMPTETAQTTLTV